MQFVDVVNAPFMREAEDYMKAHDFLESDKCKVRRWVKRVIGDRPEIIKGVTITRTYIVVTNIFDSTCTINRLALGIQENYK